MSAPTLTERLQQVAARALGRIPDRDALARELAALEANPPGYYVDLFSPVPAASPHITCEGCRAAVQAETEQRAQYATYTARVAALRVQLYRMTYGDPDEQDAAGRELATLRHEIRRAADENQRRRWGEREDEPGPRGTMTSTWVAPRTLGAIGAALSQLGAPTVESGSMPYMSTDGLRQAIRQARVKLAEIMARPTRTPIDPEVADKANVPRYDPFGRDGSDGLTPAVNTPSIIEGTVRFRRNK